MDTVKEPMTAASNIILSLSALHAAHELFKDHRAPAVGFFLVACSAGLSALPLTSPGVASVRNDLEWAGEALGPALVSFGFLWLSADRSTAHVLLLGSTLLPLLSDWLSQDGLLMMSRCLALSSLSCSLTVCLFAGNGAGVLGNVALSLPPLVAPRTGARPLVSLVSPGAAGGLLGWLLKASMVIGCWSSKQALNKYLLDLKGWH